MTNDFKSIILVIMKNLLIAVSLCLLISCGEDNPQNSEGNPPPPASNDSLVYSLDSISLRTSNAGTSLFTFPDQLDSVLNTCTITFTSETNMFNDSTLIGLYFGEFTYSNYTSFGNVYNINHTLNLSNPYRFKVFQFYIRIYNTSGSQGYLVARNVKIFKSQ